MDWATWAGVAVAFATAVLALWRSVAADRKSAEANDLAREANDLARLSAPQPDDVDVHFQIAPGSGGRLVVSNIGRSDATNVHFDAGSRIVSGPTTRERIRAGETVHITIGPGTLASPGAQLTVTWGPDRRSQRHVF